MATVTRLARSASPKYPSVRRALIGSFVAGIVGGAYELVINDNLDVRAGIVVGAAAFLGWATARELDPDRQVTALGSLAGAAILGMATRPDLLLAAAVLGALRLVVGTVGGRPTWLDCTVMVGLAGFAASSLGGWAVAAMIVIGILISGGGAAWALGAGVVGVASALLWSVPPEVAPGPAQGLAALATLIVGWFLFARPALVVSTTDIGHHPLDGNRLRVGRLLAALGVAASVLAAGLEGLGTIGPLAASVAAVAVSAGNQSGD